MNPARRQRLTLIIIAVVLFSASVLLLLFANRNQVNLFYSPTDIVQGEVPQGREIRAGGLVVVDSLVRDPDSLAVTFEVTDNQSAITMTYTGILPDLFKEGQGMMATGTMNPQGVFVAREVLARHDENYMPPEVAKALEASHRNAVNNGDPMPEY